MLIETWLMMEIIGKIIYFITFIGIVSFFLYKSVKITDCKLEITKDEESNS